MSAGELRQAYLIIAKLADASISMLNVEKAALDGAEDGLDVPYHFTKIRNALQDLKTNYPELFEEAIS